MRRVVLRCLAALAATAAALPAPAQDAYPARPVRLVVPYPPGGGNDTVGRMVAQRLAAGLGQQVVVENRPGAGGNLGTEQVARAAPDGYTITLGFVANFAMTPHLEKVGFDPLRDFTPITLVAHGYQILVVHPTSPAKSVAELVALAKAKPGVLNYGSGGNGSPLHLAAELFKQAAGIDIVHVPYRGSAPAALAVLAGDVQMLFGGVVSALPHVRAGKLRALAVTSPVRIEAAPDIPSLAELGYANVDPSSWYGLYGPAGLPAPVVQRLAREVAAFSKEPEYRDRLRKQGQEPAPGTPAEFAAFTRNEYEKYGRIIRNAGIRAD